MMLRYSCKRCGEQLFTDDDLVDHSRFQDKDTLVCTSLFTNELEWIDAFGRNQGRIHCQRCKFCVGRFCWSGAPCSCGEWIRPAFQFHCTRVELRHQITLVPKQY